MLLKNAIQRIHIYTYNRITGEPQTGDAGNITGYVSLDGTANPIDDTNPVEVDATNMPGLYYFDLTAAETNCDSFALYAKSGTTDIRIDPIIGFTTATQAFPANFSTLSIDSTGKVTYVNAAPPTTAAIADAVLSRDVASVEATAAEHSLCYLVLAAGESNTVDHAGFLTVYRTDGETEFCQKKLTSSAGAQAITGIS